MAAASIASTAIKLVGSAAASSQDSSLRFVDYWIEQGSDFETGDWITAANLGVSKIRGVLGVSAVANGGGDWAAAVSPGDIDMSCELRARAGAYAKGSSVPAAAASGDADLITLGSAFNTLAAMWIQLLVEV